MLHDEINKEKNWYFYGIEFGDYESGEFTSECLIATDKPINSDRDLLKYWPQIEPELLMVWGRVEHWEEYSISIDGDDAELATYIELMEG
jgi:hypothetical protein